MKIAIAIPCFNESKTIESVIRSLPLKISGATEISVVVVDDGSSDDTVTLARKAGAHVIEHKDNRGLGKAFQSAVEYALSSRSDCLVTIDGDGQFDSKDIVNLVTPILNGEAAFVTASRFLLKDYQPENIPAAKLWGNRQMSKLISSLVGVKYHDVSCGFRAYSKDCLLHLNLFGAFTYTQEVFLDLSFKGFKIIEVPSRVQYFSDRKSRIAYSLFNYAINTSKIIFRAYLSYYPLKVFWSSALVLLILGLSLTSIFMFHFFETGRFTGYLWAGFSGGFLIAISLFLFILGLVVDMLDRMRVSQERVLALVKQKVFYE